MSDDLGGDPWWATAVVVKEAGFFPSSAVSPANRHSSTVHTHLSQPHEVYIIIPSVIR
jgi:hypothetical protein